MNVEVQFIGLDWGTSNLRAYLYDVRGTVVATRQCAMGIRRLPEGGYPAAMQAITAGWPPCTTLAAGMVGSRQGWLEVPYIEVPADAVAIAHGLYRVDACTWQPLWIAPGLHQSAPADVMRGEETQIIGALSTQPAAKHGTHVVLPGTHSKWITLDGQRITAFHTFMTGEMFELISTRSILAAGVASERSETFAHAAFLRGVQCSRESGASGAWSRLFSARALMLEGALAPAEVADFLSGLLIGEEFRVMRTSNESSMTLHLIGEAALCQRYAIAAGHFDYATPSIVEDAAAHGLRELARCAGLLTHAQAHRFAGEAS